MMSELTIILDARLLDAARVRAQQQGTSLDALVRGHLEDYVGPDLRRLHALDDLLTCSSEATSRRGAAVYTHCDLHDQKDTDRDRRGRM